MKTQITERDGISILNFQGDLQYTNWQEMVNAASNLLDEGKTEIVISWDNVDYIDSSALGALVSIHKLIGRLPEGKSVVFTSQKDHHFVFKQAHFYSFLEIYDDLEKALESFKSVTKTSPV